MKKINVGDSIKLKSGKIGIVEDYDDTYYIVKDSNGNLLKVKKVKDDEDIDMDPEEVIEDLLVDTFKKYGYEIYTIVANVTPNDGKFGPELLVSIEIKFKDVYDIEELGGKIYFDDYNEFDDGDHTTNYGHGKIEKADYEPLGKIVHEALDNDILYNGTWFHYSACIDDIELLSKIERINYESSYTSDSEFKVKIETIYYANEN